MALLREPQQRRTVLAVSLVLIPAAIAVGLIVSVSIARRVDRRKPADVVEWREVKRRDQLDVEPPHHFRQVGIYVAERDQVTVRNIIAEYDRSERNVGFLLLCFYDDAEAVPDRIVPARQNGSGANFATWSRRMDTGHRSFTWEGAEQSLD